ncbi:MAG: bifunctional ADP-dependent NAD(P)H-hydrate dehydratase/NAD(P)H-hydrate epimerase, partial [Phycisphaerae bacterium]|nr:bifunctional ADP-dependent NAD(P)H-hydrate dehydratase/NAD(P)H-hydrate epimerase [Phycisphaerae bacterium]
MLPQPLHPPVTAARARALDAQAARSFGVSTRLLMENAGARCAEIAWRMAARVEQPTFEVWCGSGGNGGDGYVAARHLAIAGLRVRVHACGTPRAGTDAASARAAWRSLAVPAFRGTPTVVLDALLGTGFDRPAAGAPLRCIRRINARGAAG